MSGRAVKKFKSGAAMARFAAGLFAKALLSTRCRFTAALSGGRTPERLFRELAGMKLPWERVVFLMADERSVPLSSKHSNFGSARRALFSKINIPAENLIPFTTAAAYARRLKSSVAPDLVFLGLGAEGHTASIFPGSPALTSASAAMAVNAPVGIKPRRRLTLTLKTLNKARTMVLLASGPEKKAVFSRAARRDRAIPAGRLAPRGKFHLLYSERP
jgi:6-phosphogluconolactonase